MDSIAVPLDWASFTTSSFPGMATGMKTCGQRGGGLERFETQRVTLVSRFVFSREGSLLEAGARIQTARIFFSVCKQLKEALSKHAPGSGRRRVVLGRGVLAARARSGVERRKADVFKAFVGVPLLRVEGRGSRPSHCWEPSDVGLGVLSLFWGVRSSIFFGFSFDFHSREAQVVAFRWCANLPPISRILDV